MRTTASSTSLSAVGMGTTGECINFRTTFVTQTEKAFEKSHVWFL